MKRTLRDPMAICSVCHKIVKPGILPASHGYCRKCGEAAMRELKVLFIEEIKQEEKEER